MPEKRICVVCGQAFEITEDEITFFNSLGYELPKRCKACRKKKREEKQRVQAQYESEVLEKNEEEVIAELLNNSSCRQSNIEEIAIELTDDTLFIIGNGFDLMHGVQSSYYHFRDSISPKHLIRSTMEYYIHKPDVWGEFENNLAYLDREKMMGVLDDWLLDFNVLEEDDDDFSAADFFLAQDTTTQPVPILLYELPKRFRQWVNTLSFDGTLKPLAGMFKKAARYINFNYTEFLESLYDIPSERISYLHGDRRDRKQQLVLGHGRNEDQVFEEWYLANKDSPEYQPIRYGRKGRKYRNDNPVYLAYFLADETQGNWKSQMRYDSINNTQRLIEEYYSNSAKKTTDVLEKHRLMFEGLVDVKQIVVIGHSLSDVDHPYFEEIIRNTDNPHWYFSWHGSRSIGGILDFIDTMNISPDRITMFST